MKPNLEDMQVFREVVEGRSFTVAADRLGRTKSAVSQAVTRLEDDLGVRLLYRSTRSLSLTEAGTQFFAHCCDIRSAYDAALLEIKTTSANPSGTLSVTAPHALCAPVVVPSISQITKVYPRISVRLRADDAPTDLIESQIDLAIRVGEPDVQSAKVSKLGMLREGLYASPAYVAEHGGVPSDLTVLGDWDHIANEWQGVPVRYDLAGGATIRVKPKIRCNVMLDILHLAESGAGLARLPDIAAADSIAKGALVRLMEVGSVPIHSMHHFPKRPPAKIRVFAQLIREKLRSCHSASS